MISISSVLPAKLLDTATGSAHAKGKGKFTDLKTLFGASLANANAVSSTASSTSAQTSLLSQLTSLLQNGTPITNVVDQLAQSISSSVAKQLSSSYSQADLDRLSNSVKETIANALAPPSKAPPGTAAQEAAALAARLQSVVEAIAREAQSGSGQQNDIAGNILDADSAKEIPAQTQTNGTSSTLDVSSLVRSLLASAIAALSAPSSNAPATTLSSAKPVPSLPSTVMQTTSSVVAQASMQDISQNISQNVPQQSASSTLANGLLTQSTANAVASQSNISMSNAPDLLARMLVRAAGVDAQVNGDANAAAAGSATPAPANAAGTPVLSPTMLAARFAALLGDADSAAVTASTPSGNTSTGSNAGHTFDQEFGQQTPSGASAASLIATPNASSSQAQNAPQSAATGTTVNMNDVIEQMVSSMTMRTVAQGTSEIRLQLQPEDLGQVTMRLTVSGSQVSANVVAQNGDVGNALIANHQQLARSLSEAGLTLSGFSVDVSGGDAGKDQSKDRTAGFGRRYTVHELSGSTTAETNEASDPGPPLLGGTGLELFNSLA
ncbi:MAG TPA: flagellar hook-length control protein FliK [Candidatus Acidoferrales bacterium]|nr:flagellar hook-length control protein FliK [Candidatus Acidoferrales bacterium]HTX57790.1 flagellar hook-length control protein FliK [Candidatus Acidoferrales bacterium]